MRGRRAFVARAARLGLALLVTAAIGGWVKQRAISRDLSRPRDLHGTAYVGSAACAGCHPGNHASWKRTFHRSMTAEATADSVRGDFSGATLRGNGVTARMDRDPGGGYRMTFSRPGEPPRVALVARTVGSHRYQQYLTRAADDTYWRLPVAWSLEEQRWFPMTRAFLFADPSEAPGDAGGSLGDPPVFGGGAFDRHVTRWNDNCVFCHNVAPDPGRDPATGRFATTVAELGVACEACHGPGAEHVARNADPLRRLVVRLTGAADPTIVDPARLSPARAADLCGRCHGQRITADIGPFLRRGDPFVPGDELARESTPLWRDTPLHGDPTAFAARFWADGTPRLTAYEYQGFLQSPCARWGALTCTSCHGMHEGDPRGQLRAAFVRGGETQMCTGCHAPLAAPAAVRRHAHHDPAGPGGRCVACHMPRVVYGVLDVHRSHRIEVPDPAGAAAAGRPDACTGCHVDRSAAWADAAARAFWGPGRYPARPAVEAGTAPGEAIFGGEPLARAVAADALGRAPLLDPAVRARRLGALLEVMAGDRYPAVRDLAWRGLRRLAAPDAHPGTGLGADFDPSAGPAERGRAVAALRTATAAASPDPAVVARLRAASRDHDLEIGE